MILLRENEKSHNIYIFLRSRDDLPVYNSDDEDTDICALCKDSIDDVIEYGQMISIGKFRVHLLCCVSFFCYNKSCNNLMTSIRE